MRKNQLLSAVLAAAVAVSVFPAASAACVPFPDVTDPAQTEATQFLRLMGVIDGLPGGTYNPSGTLTRAEFCKMAVIALDWADQEPGQRGRTIYLDVGPAHWARGYINLASTRALSADSDGKGSTLVSGLGDGTFQPDRPIKYGEAVTILCRVLGYGDADTVTGGAWYDGYLAAGRAAGLTDGLQLGGQDVITRGQAAILFYNLYFSKSKGSGKTYLESTGGSEVDSGVILDVNATADDGTFGAVETSNSIYKTDRAFDSSIEGQEGKLVLDQDGRILAFHPKEGTSQRSISIRSAEATYLTTAAGEELDIAQDTTVYQNGEKKTWNDVYLDLAPATPAALHYGANGKLSYLFFPKEQEGGPDVMIARTTPNGADNPFASMASGGYTMYKNGLPAAAADIRQYDVATYDAATRIIQVSDLKITGVYENVSPSPSAPVTLTVMGHSFSVLPSARSDLSAFQVGDRITLLLTVSGQVAGAVSADTLKGSAVGVAVVEGQTASVTLLQSGITLSGKVSKGTAERCNNQLVTVTSSSAGILNLQKVSGTPAKGTLDTTARTLGDRKVSENVVVYDRVQNGALVQVDYSDLPASIPAGKISFISCDYAGRVQYLVLNDATGDAYSYGYFVFKRGEESEDYKEPDTLCVKQADKDGTEITTAEGSFIGSVRQGAAGGIAYGADGKVVASVTLKALENVPRSAFDTEAMTVIVGGVAYPISDEVQCFNKLAKTWFVPGKEGMKAARAYSDNLTLYYDRPASEGGKIRLAVIP